MVNICGAEPPATPAHVHPEMPAPGVQDFRLIAPSYHARASLTAHPSPRPRNLRKRRDRPGRPKIDRELRDLIRRMSKENPRWGASRIHGELLMLGFEDAQSTVSKYMMRGGNGTNGHAFTSRVRAMGIRDRPISPGSPWQNAYVECAGLGSL